MTFWDPDVDLVPTAYAVPCNIAVDFKLRTEGLRITIFNRSNDLHIGVLFNLVQFGTIAELVASRLGVDVVQQTHVSTSLHWYTDHPIHQRVAGTGCRAIDLYRHVAPLRVGNLRDEAVDRACNRLDASTVPDANVSLDWCLESPWLSSAVLLIDAQRAFREKDLNTATALLDRAPRSDWWVLAAESFTRRLCRRDDVDARGALGAIGELLGSLDREVIDFVMTSAEKPRGAAGAS